MSSSVAEAGAFRPATSRSVVSFDGTRIWYDVYDAPSRSTVVIVPGFWRDRRHPAMVRLARLALGYGYRVAVIDVRGHGDSEGTYGFNLNEHHDVAAVARELLASATAESLSFIGLSYGGAIAVSAAARHNLAVGSLLLISSVADFAMIAPRINPFTMHRHIAFGQALKRPRFEWRMLRKSTKLRAVDDVRDIHAPICLLHVKNDWLIGHEHSLALYEAANEPKELHILDVAGNYHADRIFAVAHDSAEPVMREFLLRYAPK